MNDCDALADSLRRRTRAFYDYGWRNGIMSNEALSDAAALVRLADQAAGGTGWAATYKEAISLVAQLHWARFLASAGNGTQEALAAKVLFSIVYLFAPDDVPEEFQASIPPGYGNMAWELTPGLLQSLWSDAGAHLAWEAIQSQTSSGLDEAVYLLERAIAATASDDKRRGSSFYNLGLALQARFRNGNDRGDLHKALDAASRSLEGMDRTDPMFGPRSAFRASINKELYFHTAELDYLSHAVEEYANILYLIPADHIDRIGYLLDFGDANRLLFERVQDPDMADRAISVFAALLGDLRRRKQPLLPIDRLLAQILASRFAVTDTPGRAHSPATPAARQSAPPVPRWSEKPGRSPQEKLLEGALREFEASADISILDNKAVQQTAARVLADHRRRTGTSLPDRLQTAAGWVYWYRFLFLPSGETDEDFANATTLLERAAASKPDLMPAALQAALADKDDLAADGIGPAIAALIHQIQHGTAPQLMGHLISRLAGAARTAPPSVEIILTGYIGIAYDIAYHLTGEPLSLDFALESLRTALAAGPPDGRRGVFARTLGDAFVHLAEDRGNTDALDKAIEAYRYGVSAPSSSEAPVADTWEELAKVLLNRFMLAGALHDIDAAIEALEQSINCTENPGKYDSRGALLCWAYFHRMQATGASEDSGTFLSAAWSWVHSLSVGTSEHRVVCGLIGKSLVTSALDEDSTDADAASRHDLEQAIEMLRLATDDSPEYELSENVGLLLWLGQAEKRRYRLSGHLTDLNQAIVSYARALAVTGMRPTRALILQGLGTLLHLRFAHGRRTLQLDASVALLREAADCAENTELRHRCQEDLALSLTARFDATARRSDLDEAIDITRQAIPQPHAFGMHGTLAKLLVRRYHLTSSPADLDEAMLTLEIALNGTIPPGEDQDELERALATARGLAREASVSEGRAATRETPAAPADQAALESLLAQVRAGALGIEQAEALMPPFDSDHVTARLLARLAHEAHRMLSEKQWPEALLRSRLLVAGMRDVLPDSAAATARADASAALVMGARDALIHDADPSLYGAAPLLYEAANRAGLWALALAEARNNREATGYAAYCLGTLHLDMYQQNPAAKWWRQQQPDVHIGLTQSGQDEDKALPERANLTPAMPKPLAAVRMAAGFLRQAAHLSADESQGEACKQFASALIELRTFGDPVDEHELRQALENALRLIPKDKFHRSLPVALLLDGASIAAEAQAIASALSNGLPNYVDQEGPEAAVAAVYMVARALADEDAVRAMTLLDRIAGLTDKVPERLRRHVLDVRGYLASKIYAPGWHPPSDPLLTGQEVTDYLDSLDGDTGCPGDVLAGRLIGCSVWADEKSGGEEDGNVTSIQLGLQALEKLKQLVGSDPAAAGVYRRMSSACAFRRASLLNRAARCSPEPEKALLLAAAVLELCQCRADQLATMSLELMLQVVGAVDEEDVPEVLATLGTAATYLYTSDNANSGVLQHVYARLLGALLSRGRLAGLAFELLVAQAKGASLGMALLAGAPAVPMLDEGGRDMLASVVALDTAPETEPSPSFDQRLWDEAMTLAWADRLQRRPADTPVGRLRNRQRAFDQHLSSLMGQGHLPAAAPVDMGALRQALGERTVLSLYMPVLNEEMHSGLAHFIISSDSFWGTFWFDHRYPEFGTRPDAGTVLSGSAYAFTTVLDLRISIQDDPGPATVTGDALRILDDSTGQSPLDPESLGELARLRAAGKDQLLIAPYGPFHFFPFHLLGPRDRPSLSNWKVAYLPNLNLLLRSLTGSLRTRSITSIGLDYLNPPHLALPPLRGAVAEATECASLFGTAPILNGSATKDRVLAALHTSRYVHIAAHGTHNPDAPAFQAIHLAPGPADDGRLSAHELLSHDLSGIELVTLSACDTALGRIDSSDNLRGIPAALFLAGVPVIVAAMWPVSDVVAAYFFPTFYKCLAQGQRITDAFRDAQGITRERFSQYRDWGAFVMGGRGIDDHA